MYTLFWHPLYTEHFLRSLQKENFMKIPFNGYIFQHMGALQLIRSFATAGNSTMLIFSYYKWTLWSTYETLSKATHFQKWNEPVQECSSNRRETSGVRVLAQKGKWPPVLWLRGDHALRPPWPPVPPALGYHLPRPPHAFHWSPARAGSWVKLGTRPQKLPPLLSQHQLLF